MIASLSGIIQEKESSAVIVEAGGVGYQVQVSAQTLSELPDVGETCRLWTHFYVREDSQQLFGFASTQERKIFLLLLTVKGVGPKLALAILSGLRPEGLIDALAKGQVALLNKLPGVGKKLAERMAVELRDKAVELGGGNGSASGGFPVDGLGDAAQKAVEALQNLGFGAAQAKKAVQNAHKTLGQEDARVEDIVKTALKMI